MKPREKEDYLRNYQVLKSQGKPFFPYAVLKDSTMAAIVLAVIIAMSIILGAGELANRADPTTTTYTPRPDWYFYFLFELLRVIKPPSLVVLATVGIPTICLVLLLLLPFYDRNPERRPERRPIATTTAVAVIAAMAYLTYMGAHAGAPDQIDLKVPASVQAFSQRLFHPRSWGPMAESETYAHLEHLRIAGDADRRAERDGTLLYVAG